MDIKRSSTLLTKTVHSLKTRVENAVREHDEPGATFEFWSFTGREERKQLEQEFAAAGTAVTLHSAYKPLVLWFVDLYESNPQNAPIAVTVTCPTHPLAAPRRFELEAYPLARMLAEWWPGTTFALESAPESGDFPAYTVELTYRDAEQTHTIVAPNHGVTTATGREAFTPCGWMRITSGANEVRESPFETPYEELFASVMEVIRAQQWTGSGPFFEQLDISMAHNGEDLRLPVQHERIDTAEAMHEELYFSILEYFAHVSGLPDGSRLLTPGQVMPRVRNVVGGENTVTVALRAWEQPVEEEGKTLTPGALQAAVTRVDSGDISATMQSLPGTKYTGKSVIGRTVHGLWRDGSRPAVVINGGQHANENSGVIGALRAAHELLQDPDANIGLVALENPDGYALHKELIDLHPEHMHHAARYSALGNDVSFHSNDNPYEIEVRNKITADSDAQLIVNLHGYPAHEWTRPLSGYLPNGFEWWAMPQGFILMARYQPGYAEIAEELLRTVAKHLQDEVPGLVAYNKAMLDTYELHAGKLLFPLEGVIPLALSEARSAGPAIEMITEYPDETVTGFDFHLAHETQFVSALRATQTWWKLYRNSGN